MTLSADDLEKTIGMRLELWPIERLRPFERNARQITTDDVSKLAAVIARQGFLDPISVQPGGEVLAGHRRLLAAKQLGLVRVPVLVQLDLSKDAGDAYRIEHNRLSEDVKWDRALLADEVLRVTDLLSLQADDLGFDEKDIAKLFDLDGGPPAPEGIEASPEVQPLLERGEWWQIGPCRFQVYKNLNAEALLKAEVLIGKISKLVKAEPLLGGDESYPWKKVVEERRLAQAQELT